MIASSNHRTLLHLSLIDGIGPAAVLKILDRWEQSLETLYSASMSQLIQIGLSEKKAQCLVEELRSTQLLDEELELIQKHQITVLTLLDAEYPQQLRHIHLPPSVLYCKGASLASFEKTFAIVGARTATAYAQQVIDNLTPELVAHNWAIVSGGAAGVDTMAHRAALQAGGQTVVVFGAGLLRDYPAENRGLFREVAQGGGVLVSAFPLRMRPLKENFPARNRVISGLSAGCLVVQAAAKSGALITAQFALEQGRQIFAVPGSVFEPLSAGCHGLLAQGAKLVCSAKDILEEFGEASAASTKEIPKIIDDNPIVMQLDRAISLDELSIRLAMDASHLQNELFMLQLEGKVQQNFIGHWERA